MGDWWYIVYSDSFKAPWCRKVKYKKAKSFEELKTLFGGDAGERVLDSRGFYAGKTASNGTDRFIWGWCPIRTDNDGFISNKIDEMNVNVGGSFGNEPAWSGALVCHKIIQHEDGNISLGPVPAIASKYGRERGVTVMASNNATLNGTGGQLTGDDSYVLYNRLGFHNHISFTVKTAGNTDKFGVSLVRYTGAKQYYSLILNPEGDNDRKVNFEQESPEGSKFIEGIDGYNFPRPTDNVYHIDIYTDNSVMVMYINGDWAYTNRIYGIQNNCWSINNYGGEITVSDVRVREY
jgi:beta-fructofuranosidase